MENDDWKEERMLLQLRTVHLYVRASRGTRRRNYVNHVQSQPVFPNNIDRCLNVLIQT